MRRSISFYLEFVVFAVLALALAYLIIQKLHKTFLDPGEPNREVNVVVTFFGAIIANLTAYLIIKLFFGDILNPKCKV